MRRFIGADSLAFLSVEGIYRAMGYEQRDPLRPQFTDTASPAIIRPR